MTELGGEACIAAVKTKLIFFADGEERSWSHCGRLQNVRHTR